MVRCYLHSTVVDDAARNKMIIVHPKPPHLSFILDCESYVVRLQGEEMAAHKEIIIYLQMKTSPAGWAYTRTRGLPFRPLDFTKRKLFI